MIQNTIKTLINFPYCYDDWGLGLNYLVWCRIKWHTLEALVMGHPGAKMRGRCQDHTSHSHRQPALQEMQNRKQLILHFQTPCKAQLGGPFEWNCLIKLSSRSTNSTDPFSWGSWLVWYLTCTPLWWLGWTSASTAFIDGAYSPLMTELPTFLTY